MCNVYQWPDFVLACEKHEVSVYRKASVNAMQKFKFTSDKAVLDFIAEEAFDEIEPKKPLCRPLEEDLMKSQGVPVHSYKFRIDKDYGYLAIFRMKQNQRWVLKSFDKDEQEASPLKVQMFSNLKLPGKSESSNE